MKIAVGADHAGVELKNVLRDTLIAAGHEVVDVGTQGNQSVDYPDFAHAVARAVAKGEAERGLLVCGTGQGMAISANRHAGVRAACTRDLYDTRLVREHNDANVLCIGARVVGAALADEMVKTFLATVFAGGRHAGRVRKMEEPS
ncbi:MAG: ribose 5-phosphate isomerase B [Planctomycetes bacterium]|nr:ribose 5-phosphate isomerase B [Planctomycetota bacterium]